MSSRGMKKKQSYTTKESKIEHEDKLFNKKDFTPVTPPRSRTPPVTPPRRYNNRSWADMMDSPTPPTSPPRTPGKALSPPSTPNPRSPPKTPIFSPPRWKRDGVTHNPYTLPSTPNKSPVQRKLQTERNSPKARTPTRTRLAVQQRNSPPAASTPSVNISPTISAHSVGTLQIVSSPASPEAQVMQLVLSPQQANPSPQQSPPQQLMLQYALQQSDLPPSLQQTMYQTNYDQTSDENQSPMYQYQLVASPNGQLTLAPQLSSPTSLAYPVITTADGFQYIQAQPRLISTGYTQPTIYQTIPTMSPIGGGSPTATQLVIPTTQTVFTTAQPVQSETSTSSGTSTPTAAGANSKIYMVVEFKRGRALQYQATFWAQPGNYVIVEGDNGEDLGMVVHTWLAPSSSTPVVNNSLNSNRNSSGNDVDPITGDPIYPKVIRHATTKEVQHLHNAQAQAEMKCTEQARQKVIEHSLPMTIIDAEYQFDRQKLTFYYDAGERIDFRELVRDLYKMYRARIWMSKTRSSQGEESPTPPSSSKRSAK